MKTELINYLLEANILLLIAGALYYSLLHREHCFQFKRMYVLFSIILAWFIPLIDLTIPSSTKGITTIPTIYLPTLTIGQINSQSAPISIWLQILPYIYLVGSCIGLGAFIYQLSMIWSLTKKTIREDGKSRIIYIDGQMASFSFFHLIFINQGEIINPEAKAKIIAHEEVHARQWHSLDMIVLYLTRIFFWYNPIVWFFKSSQQETHEFLVDQEMILTEDKSSYQQLLAIMTVGPYYNTGSYFAKNQTIKRINMMNEKLKKPHWLRIGVAQCSMLVLMGTLVCNAQLVNTNNSAQMVADIPESVQQNMERLENLYPSIQLSYIEMDMPKGDLTPYDLVEDPESIQYSQDFPERDKLGLVLSTNTKEFKQLEEYKKSTDQIFDEVEDQPMPIGGMRTFYEYIGQNMKYPIKAKEKGVEGMVFIQFIVNETGKLTEVRAMKGIGHGCDQEAIRVIEEAESWKPGKKDGKPVNVRMILPITFSLGQNDNSKSE